MMCIQRLTITTVTILLLAGTAVAQETPPRARLHLDRQTLEAFMDQTIVRAMARDHVAGGVVAVVKNGRLFFAKGYGLADHEAQRPVDPAQTVFRVGSLAKLFVGTAVMQLVDEGRLELDADVNTYLEAFKLPATYPQPITLRHLLTHTAGFEVRLIGADRHRPEGDIRPLAEALPDLMPARVRPPGEIASYSNWGVTLAGYIVERVAGISFAAYVDRNIFAPLNMKRSTFREPLPASLEKDFAAGYHYQDGTLVPQAFEIIADFGPAGALSSTAGDMARFMIAHLENGRGILSATAAAEMHRLQFVSHPALPGLALNFGLASRNGRPLLQHNGATFVFHANLALWPREYLGLFVAFNGPGSAGDRVLEAFLERYDPRSPPAVLPPAVDHRAHLQRYAGTYRSNRLSFAGLQKALHINELTIQTTDRGTLFLGDLLSDADNPAHGLELAAVGPDMFWHADQNLQVAFSKGDTGEMENLFVGSALSSFHRITWYESVHALVTATAFAITVYIVAGAWRISGLIRGRRNRVAGSRWLDIGSWALIGLCLSGTCFVAGFVIAVRPHTDAFHYPSGIEALLCLPLLNALLTPVAAIAVIIAWCRRYGKLRVRIADTVVVLTSGMFLCFLGMWNLLGWQL